METRYCIEYVNPRHPLCDNGSLNVRYDRVLTLEQAEHDLTLILSFDGKILDLYMGNVVDGKTGEWSPKPMIIDDDDWFSTKWLNTLKVKEVNLELENENNNPKITVGTKIRSKANPDLILSIISNDCHEDEFECSNGSVLSLKQIEKYYDIIS